MSIYEWGYAVAALAEAVGFYFLFEALLQRRKRQPDWIYILGVGTLALGIWVCNEGLAFRFSHIIGTALFALLFSFLYTGTIKQRAAIVALGLLLRFLVEALTGAVLAVLVQPPSPGQLRLAAYLLLEALVARLSFLAVGNALRVYNHRHKAALGKTYWFLVLLQYLSIVMVSVLLYRLSFVLNVTTYNIAVVCAGIGLLIGVAFSPFLYEYQSRQNAAHLEKEQHEQQLRLQMKHLDDILARQQEMRKLRHDLANQMTGLRGFLQAEDTASALHHLDTLSQQLQHTAPAFDTGNIALDAILSTKKALAESKGIAFETKLRIPERLPIAAEDVCVIFGNALDNAIEACERLDAHQPRHIALSLIQREDILLCKIVNTAPPKKGDVLMTVKPDKENHGFGLSNICDSLAKYDCKPELIWQEGTFTLSFMIML